MFNNYIMIFILKLETFFSDDEKLMNFFGVKKNEKGIFAGE